MLEDRGLGEFRLVGLRRVTVLRRQRANIDERLDAIIRARSGDDGAPKCPTSTTGPRARPSDVRTAAASSATVFKWFCVAITS
jgi:hypothetical protein